VTKVSARLSRSVPPYCSSLWRGPAYSGRPRVGDYQLTRDMFGCFEDGGELGFADPLAAGGPLQYPHRVISQCRHGPATARPFGGVVAQLAEQVEGSGAIRSGPLRAFLRRDRRRRIALGIALRQVAEDKAHIGQSVGFAIGRRVHAGDAQAVVDADPHCARPGRHRHRRIEPGKRGFQATGQRWCGFRYAG